jgi:hypothetical protein
MSTHDWILLALTFAVVVFGYMAGRAEMRVANRALGDSRRARRYSRRRFREHVLSSGDPRLIEEYHSARLLSLAHIGLVVSLIVAFLTGFPG